MEEDDDFRTMECLRGRLAAERQTSKTAKEEVELMVNKILELEKKLTEESKLKKIAEKKLILFMKKLESLNLSTVLSMKSEKPNSSEISEISRCSSTNSSHPEENEAKFQISSSFLSQKPSENHLSDQKNALIEEENGRAQVNGSSSSSSGDYFTDHSSCSSKSSMDEKESKDEEG